MKSNAADSYFTHIYNIYDLYLFYIYFTVCFTLLSTHMKVSTDAPNPKSPKVGVKRGLPLEF